VSIILRSFRDCYTQHSAVASVPLAWMATPSSPEGMNKLEWTIRESRYSALLHDLEHVIRSVGKDVITTEHVQTWAVALASFAGLGAEERLTDAAREYDRETFQQHWSLELSLAAASKVIVRAACDRFSAEQMHQSLSFVSQMLHESTSELPSAEYGYHCPLSRLLAALLQGEKHRGGSSRIHLRHCSQAVMPAMRTLALSASVGAGKWVRNGISIVGSDRLYRGPDKSLAQFSLADASLLRWALLSVRTLTTCTAAHCHAHSCSQTDTCLTSTGAVPVRDTAAHAARDDRLRGQLGRAGGRGVLGRAGGLLFAADRAAWHA